MASFAADFFANWEAKMTVKKLTFDETEKCQIFVAIFSRDLTSIFGMDLRNTFVIFLKTKKTTKKGAVSFCNCKACFMGLTNLGAKAAWILSNF